MTALHHVFLHGVRADTEVRYQAQALRGIRYDDLHHQQSRIDASCGLLSVLQAIMVLCGTPRSQIERVATTKREPLRSLWALARNEYFEGTDESELRRYVEVFGPQLECEVSITSRPSRIGTLASTAIDAGHVPLIRFESRKFDHFSMVVGYESEVGQPAPRALLLLDVSESAPWTAFHNGRIELQASSRPARKGSTTFPLTCHYLSGETWPVKLKSLVVIKRVRPP